MSHDAAARVGLEIFVRTFLGMRPPDRVMRQLAGMMRELEAPTGTVLYERGDPATEIFMIQEGRVALVGEDDSRWTFEDQSMIGIVDASLDRPYSRTAIVEEPVFGARMMFADYGEVIEDNFDFTIGAIQRGTFVSWETALKLGPHDAFPPPSSDEVLQRRGDDDRRLEMVERLMVLHRSVLFADAPIQPLVSLANHAEEHRFEAGETIYEVGDPSDSILFVANGLVEIEQVDPKIVARFGPGDVVAGIFPVAHDCYPFSARAIEPTRLLRITQEDLFDVAEDHFGIARAVLSYNSRDNARVRSLLERIQTGNLENAS